jgi:hypothetical protein
LWSRRSDAGLQDGWFFFFFLFTPNSFQDGQYILRVCGDPSERIDGQLNPNLFVCSYLQDGQLKNLKVFRFPNIGVGVERSQANCAVFSSIDALLKSVIGENAAPVPKA